MAYMHINRFRADVHENLWCPYCDEVLPFAHQFYYEDWICTKCGRSFPYHYQWPRGFDIKTGLLEK
jgi:ribosomal protein L37AE/L43A